MKSLLRFGALFLCATALAHADLVVVEKVESTSVHGEVTVKIKGDRVRMDMDSARTGPTTMLIDVKSGNITMLLRSKNLAVKTNVERLRAGTEARQKAAGIDLAKFEPKATGQKEKVGAWDCEIFSGDLGGGNTGKLWVAKDFPGYEGIKGQVAKFRGVLTALGVDPIKTDLGGMKIKSEINWSAGQALSSLVSAKEEDVPESDFAVPADYQEVAMPEAK